MKEALYDTKLPVLEVNKSEIGRCLGYGNEGEVHVYKDFAIKKIYKMTENKIRKIEELGTLRDENILFPIGFFGYDSLYKEGYYMPEVIFGDVLRDFDDLKLLYDMKRKLKIIKEADGAIRRLHKKGMIIGDIKGDNILIDENDRPMWGDTDNYKFGDYGFDVAPTREDWLSYAFYLNKNRLDNDKYVWALLVLRVLFRAIDLYYQPSSVELRRFIQSIDVSKETKEIIETILSDAKDKPYIGDIIDEKNFCLK